MSNVSVEKAINYFKRSYASGDTDDERQHNEALDMAIKALRYKPIILQEHDAEPRRLRAILDTATEEIYVRMLTKQGADVLGMTIEEADIDGK